MSLRATQWAWEHGPRQQTQRLVLLALADRANDAGECWPSMDELASRACVAVRNARMAVRALEDGGYIETRLNRGRKHANTYRLTFAKPDASIPFSAEKPDASIPPENRTVASHFPIKPDARGHKTGCQHPPNRKEPSYEGVGVARAREADPHLEILDAAGIDWQADVTGRCFNSVERGYVARWETDLGLSRDEILSVLRETTPANRGEPPKSLRYFDGERGPMAKRAGQIAALSQRLDPAIPQTAPGGRLSVRDPAVRAATLQATLAAMRKTYGDDC